MVDNITRNADAYFLKVLASFPDAKLNREQLNILRFSIFLIYYLENLQKATDAMHGFSYDIWVDSLIKELKLYINSLRTKKQLPFLNLILSSLIINLSNCYIYFLKPKVDGDKFYSALDRFLKELLKLPLQYEEVITIISENSLIEDDSGRNYDASVQNILASLRDLLYLYRINENIMIFIKRRMYDLSDGYYVEP